MTAYEGAWDAPTWVIPNSRFLEYTHPAIEADFKSLNDETINRIKAMPTLFCYEQYIDSPAKIGQITEIQRRASELKITYSINHDIPLITQSQLRNLFPELDVDPNSYEVTRTHWAIKDANLIAVLKQSGFIHDQPLMAQPRPPKIFISYSWDSPEHKQWVAGIGGALRLKGLDVTLDQWHVRGGEDMSVFMERSIREADRVLVICTEQYCHKARNRFGGVGYESHILTSEIMQQVGTTKFIPIIKNLPKDACLPDALRGRYYYDLSEGEAYFGAFEALLRELHDAPLPIPPIGPNPFLS